MIYKKQSLKSKVENLHSWLFSFIILMIVVNASVKAQDLDDRSRFKTVTTLDATRNDTIVISQIQMDSIGCDAFCSSTGLHSIFSFLKENIDYQSKAVEMGIQGEIIAGFTISKSKKIINSRIIKGLCMDLDKEVLQTIKKMPVWKLSEDNVDSVLEPRVSVVGIETGSQKFTVKRMNGINCGSMAVYGVHDAGGDSIFSKTITIINEDTNR